jgi:hypothetical protein
MSRRTYDRLVGTLILALVVLLAADVLVSARIGRRWEGNAVMCSLWDSPGYWAVALLRMSEALPLGGAAALLRPTRRLRLAVVLAAGILVLYTYTLVVWQVFVLAYLEGML